MAVCEGLTRAAWSGLCTLNAAVSTGRLTQAATFPDALGCINGLSMGCHWTQWILNEH